MNETLLQRAKRVFGYLAISIFLSGGCVSLASMEMDPTEWPSVCRPLFLLLSFLFFQWLYKDVEKKITRDADSIQRFEDFKKRTGIK